jgi:hypothetical protein
MDGKDLANGCPVCGHVLLPDGTCPIVGEPWHEINAEDGPPLVDDLDALEDIT